MRCNTLFSIINIQFDYFIYALLPSLGIGALKSGLPHVVQCDFRGITGYQGGEVDIIRPRVRGADGDEVILPRWTAGTAQDWLGKTAMNLMLILRYRVCLFSMQLPALRRAPAEHHPRRLETPR